MTDTTLPAILLVDDDALLLRSLARVLRRTAHPILLADNPDQAGNAIQSQEVGVIMCEPRDIRLASFLIETRRHHPATVRIILSGYPDLISVLKAVNQAHPFQVLSKPWMDDELIDTINLAFEQYAINRKRDRLISEYNGIRSNAEYSHAFHALGALAHVVRRDMHVQAIQDLSVGAFLLVDGDVVIVNPAAQRFLTALNMMVPATGSAFCNMPPEFSAALAAPRGQRIKQKLPGNGKFDYVALDIAAGTLIAFAPEPQSFA
ncbi:MAG: response regulator [Burkholderiales bacterium]|nr:response regulator [Burkholderiales bacterium]